MAVPVGNHVREGPSPKRARCDAVATPPSAEACDVADDAGTAGLLAWLKSHGGFVDGVRVVGAGAAGLRLVASRHLPAGFVWARVPETCALGVEACVALAHGQEMQKHFELVVPKELDNVPAEASSSGPCRPVVTRRSVLYAALMVAPVDEGSPFGPHIAALRGCAAATPFTWAEDSGIEFLEEAWKDVPAAVKEEWFDAWDTLHIEHSTLFPTLSDHRPDLFPSESCTEAAWIRAHSLYTSRAFPLRPEVSSPDGVLLPLLDRLNHDTVKCNVEWRGVGLEENRGARTTRAIEAGEELFYSYGCKGNVDLICDYGFAVWGNPHEVSRVVVDVEELAKAGGAKLDRAAQAFEGALDRICGAAQFCDRRDPGRATFRLAAEDLDAARKGGPWRALCRLCSALHVCLRRPSPEDLLQDILMKSCEGLLGNKADGVVWQPDEWEAHVAAVRSDDAVDVSECASCATTAQGMTLALRHAQLSVVRAAMRKLADQAPLPKQRKGKGRGRGRGRSITSTECGEASLGSERLNTDEGLVVDDA